MTKSNYYKMPSIKAINAKAKKSDIIGVSFFAGCGGSSTGLKMAGINVKYASEFIPAAVETYKANAPQTYVDDRDIRKVKPKEVLKILGLKAGELDHMDFSPPCSSYSTAGARDKGWNKAKHYSDGVHQRTDDLFDASIPMLAELAPKTFTMENVPGLVQGKAKGVFLDVLAKLKAAGPGYEVSVRCLNASLLGVPQARERLIFVGVRKDLVKLGFKPLHPEPLDGPVPTVREALPHIVAVKAKYHGDLLTYVPSDIPSPTITASDGQNSETAAFSCGGFVEDKDGKRRKYKISELKKICAFPDDFVFTGKYEQQFERMGRAVPPLMMARVALRLTKEILQPYNALPESKRAAAKKGLKFGASTTDEKAKKK